MIQSTPTIHHILKKDYSIKLESIRHYELSMWALEIIAAKFNVSSNLHMFVSFNIGILFSVGHDVCFND